MTHLLAFVAIIATVVADVSHLYGPPQVYGPPKTIYGSPQITYGVPQLTYGPPKVRSGHSSYDVPQESVTGSLFSPTTPSSNLLVPLLEAQDFRSLEFASSPVPFGFGNSFGFNPKPHSVNLDSLVSSTPSPISLDSVVSSTVSPVVSSTPVPGLDLGSVISSTPATRVSPTSPNPNLLLPLHEPQEFRSFGFSNPAPFGFGSSFGFSTPAPNVVSSTPAPLTFDTVVSSTPAPIDFVSSTPSPLVTSGGDSGLNSVLFNRLAQSFPSLTFNYNDIALATPAPFVDSSISFEEPGKVSKQVYFFDAPEEEVVQPKIRVISPPPQKSVKLIFVKAPTQPSASSVKLVAPPAIEEKTVVYVLSKNPEEQQIEIEAGTNQKTSSKPEVYFVKYNNQAEAQEAVNKIQAQGHHEDQIGALDVPHHHFIGALGKSNIPQPIIKYAHSKGASQIVPLPGSLNFDSPILNAGFQSVPLSTGFGFTTSPPLLNSFSTTTLAPVQDFSSILVPSLVPNSQFPSSSNFGVTVSTTPSPVVSSTYTSPQLLNSFSTTTAAPVQDFSSILVPGVSHFPSSSNFGMTVSSTPSPVVSSTYAPLSNIVEGDDINQNLVSPELSHADGVSASSTVAPETVTASSTETRAQTPFSVYGPPTEDRKR
ncbi:unnamed protein product [Callosobruchus maculatus]|uniref:DUF243 domain-containing protein n=1 Tax=Callosobruchus maculatus TaxID=64391 RepID=A0A653C307_CALMS|nr:unnamed protein product [Callosobruchus maculatus]